MHKNIRASVLFILAVIPALCIPVRAEEVHWYNSIEEASLAAREQNKPMLLEFSADWCAACKVMEKDVYNDNRFEQSAQNFLTVRVDYDKKTAVARKYNVVALPTLVFTDSYGDELLRYRGFIDAKPLSELMLSLPADVSEFNRLSNILAGDRNNVAALEDMGRNLRSAGLFLTSSDYYQKALQRISVKADAPERESILEQIGLNSLEVKDGNRAAATFERCLKEFPASPKSAEWTLNLGRAYLVEEKKDKARKILEAFLRQHPGGAESEKARAMLASQ